MSGTAWKRLWHLGGAGGDVECRLASGCGVVELRVERAGEILRRESYPDASTAYERARALRAQYERTPRDPAGG
jgi:hypothetical protein